MTYAREGERLVGVDLNEVVAYSGYDESLLWTVTTRAQVVCLALAAEQVVALDSQGRIERRWASSGELEAEVALEAATAARAAPRAMALSDQGRCAVALADRIALEQEGELRYFSAADVVDLAFRDDGMALAVGLDSGEVRLLDLLGHVMSAARLDAPVEGLCWSPRGQWLISAGGRVFAWDGSAVEEILALSDQTVLDSPTCSASGALIALRSGPSIVSIFELDGARTVGTVEYEDRRVGSVVFGPELWLAIGLDQADGNRMDLATAAVHRTSPREGQEARSWTVVPRLRTELAIEIEGGRPPLPEELDAVPSSPPVQSSRPLPQRSGDVTLCPRCGEPGEGWICTPCGAVLVTPEDLEGELATLDELGEVLRAADEAGRVRLLREGFLPTRAKALIVAGRRCGPLLPAPGARRDDLGEAATMRLASVVSRLKRMRQNPERFRAILELEGRLREARPPRRAPLILLIVLLGLALAIGAAAIGVWFC